MEKATDIEDSNKEDVQGEDVKQNTGAVSRESVGKKIQRILKKMF